MDRDVLAKAMFYANENPYMAADAILEAIADAAPEDSEGSNSSDTTSAEDSGSNSSTSSEEGSGGGG